MARRQARLWRELDLNLVRTFHVLVEEGSLTRAGERLLLAQPTMSNALKRLEEQVGQRLVDRSSRHFRLTAGGEAFARHAAAIMAEVDALCRLAAGEDAAGSETIHIATASHVVCPFLDDVLATFLETHPGLRLSTSVMASTDVMTAVEQGAASLGICLVADHRPALTARLLYREHFGFYCAPGHPLFGRHDVTVDDLRGADYVTFRTDEEGDSLAAIARLRRALGLAGRIVGRFTNVEEVRRMMRLAQAFAPLPVHVAEPDVAAGQLWPLSPSDQRPLVDVWAVFHPSLARSLAEEAFIARLVDRIADTPIAVRTYG